MAGTARQQCCSTPAMVLCVTLTACRCTAAVSVVRHCTVLQHYIFNMLAALQAVNMRGTCAHVMYNAKRPAYMTHCQSRLLGDSRYMASHCIKSSSGFGIWWPSARCLKWLLDPDPARSRQPSACNTSHCACSAAYARHQHTASGSVLYISHGLAKAATTISSPVLCWCLLHCRHDSRFEEYAVKGEQAVRNRMHIMHCQQIATLYCCDGVQQSVCVHCNHCGWLS